MPHLSIDARLAALAQEQHGVLTSADLRALGIDRRAVSRRVAAGVLTRVMPRVYVTAPYTLRQPDTRCSVGLRASPRGAALSHLTAVALHDMWERDLGRRADTVHVTIPISRRAYGAAWLQVHESTDIGPVDVTSVRGMPVTRPCRTLCDLGSMLTRHQVANVIDRLTYLELYDRAEVERILDRRWRAPGSAVVREAVHLHESGSGGTRSWSEDHLLQALLHHGVAEPLVNVRGAAGLPGYEPDLLWPQERVIVEVDGQAHQRAADRRADAARDAWLREHGWRLLRFSTTAVWTGRGAILGAITEALSGTDATRHPFRVP